MPKCKFSLLVLLLLSLCYKGKTMLYVPAPSTSGLVGPLDSSPRMVIKWWCPRAISSFIENNFRSLQTDWMIVRLNASPFLPSLSCFSGLQW